MWHGMPQSLIVFAVSSTMETSNFGTFGGVVHSIEFFSYILNVYMHIFEIQAIRIS